LINYIRRALCILIGFHPFWWCPWIRLFLMALIF
jgi:hypothetical protein